MALVPSILSPTVPSRLDDANTSAFVEGGCSVTHAASAYAPQGFPI